MGLPRVYGGPYELNRGLTQLRQPVVSDYYFMKAENLRSLISDRKSWGIIGRDVLRFIALRLFEGD